MRIIVKMLDTFRPLFEEQGKLKKFYTENCLLDQPFVKDDSKTVAQFVADSAKQAGGEAKIVNFVRFSVG